MKMLTYSGNEVDLEDFQEKDVNLIDIAVSLSRQNRYLGHSMFPFSVGQHTIFCAMIANALGDSEDIQHFAILHDAHEFVYQDIIRPVSGTFPNKEWKDAKADADAIIFRFFNLYHLLMDQQKVDRMKTIDNAAGIIERICLFPTYSWEEAKKNYPAPVRKMVDTLMDLNFKIPEDLLTMHRDAVAENLHEVMAVMHFEKTTGSEIVLDDAEVIVESA
jgi:5'-deoxynucleotidase YfbR-like HD superfamily hydrolase